MPLLGYQSVLSAPAVPDSLDSIIRVLQWWATKKRRFSALPRAGQASIHEDGSRLTAIQATDDERDITAFRWTLEEQWDPPKWYMNLTTSRRAVMRISLVFSGGRVWLWTDIEPPVLDYFDSAGTHHVEAQTCGTPAFISKLLEVVDFQDGAKTPSAEVDLIISSGHVDYLESVLSDRQRRGVVYVSTPPEGIDASVWSVEIKKRLGRFEGMGFAFVLDGEGRSEFNSRAGDGRRIPAGAIRTFLPGVDFDNPGDAFRHRLIHAATIQNSAPGRIRRIIGNARVSHLRSLPLPQLLRDADYSLLKEQSGSTLQAVRHEVESRSAGMLTAEESRTLREAEELVNMALEDNDQLKRQAEALHEDAEFLRLEVEELSMQLSRVNEQRESLSRERDYLRQSLTELGGTAAERAFSFLDSGSPQGCPETFAELYERMLTMDGIRFFGQQEDVEELDEFSDLGAAAIQKAWDALRTFSAYSCARRDGRYAGSLVNYIKDSSHGIFMYARGVKWGEGQTVRTNSKMSSQREVSNLPREISESGKKVLVAHIALATGRGNSPRMYFDDTFVQAGFVTIGYFGSHLDNTLTN